MAPKVLYLSALLGTCLLVVWALRLRVQYRMAIYLTVAFQS